MFNKEVIQSICFEHGITKFEFEAIVSSAIAEAYGFYGAASYDGVYASGFLPDKLGKASYRLKSIKITKKNIAIVQKKVAMKLEDYIPFSHYQHLYSVFSATNGLARGVISEVDHSCAKITFLEKKLTHFVGFLPLDYRHILQKDIKGRKYSFGQELDFALAVASKKMSIMDGKFAVELTRQSENLIRMHLGKIINYLAKSGVSAPTVSIASISYAKNLIILRSYSKLSEETKGFIAKKIGFTVKYIES